MHQTEIWTERLLLRAAEPNDLDAFRKWFQDPESMNYWSTPPHTDIEQTKNFLANMIGSPQNGVLDFVVCLQGSDPSTPTSSTFRMSSNNSGPGTDTESPMTVIGKAGLYDGQEIGFMFDRDYWGKGYAFEALDAIVKHYWAVKEDQPDAVIKADVDPRNTKSLRLLHKLGFVEVGTAKNTFETHLGWCDSVYLEARRSA